MRRWLMLLMIILTPTAPALAEEPLTVVAWAPVNGPEALWRDSLGGLKAAAALFNAHGGPGGRPLELVELNSGEDQADFLAALGQALGRPGTAAAGGPVRGRAGETADYLRRLDRPWFGPWSNEPGLYQGRDSDPFALLPTWAEEMPALLNYVRASGRGGPVVLVHPDDRAGRELAAETRRLATRAGLKLTAAQVAADFRAWPELAGSLREAGAVLVWLSPGASAALVRAAKAINPEALYLTSSINATHRSLVSVSGGAWNGVIFAAVLVPSRDIPAAYGDLIGQYGPVGLESGYQTLLGFVQGQLLARAAVLGQDSERIDLKRGLYDLNDFPSLLSSPPRYAPGQRLRPDSFYLGRAVGPGQWEAAPEPEKIKKRLMTPSAK